MMNEDREYRLKQAGEAIGYAGNQNQQSSTGEDITFNKIPNYTAIRTAAKHLEEVIMQNSPISADQSTALRCVREACLWANASIELDGDNL